LIDDAFYKGDFEVRRDNQGLYFITTLPLERYTAGVIAAETGDDWAIEALKAQAVISRTYALYQKIHAGREDYHITSSILHQVYRGDTDDDRIQRAVEETGGEVLTFKGELIKSFYHATCTGKTELPGEVWGESHPYLQSVPCRGENAPYEQWQRRFQRGEIEKALGLKGIRDMYISSHTATGRVDRLTSSAIRPSPALTSRCIPRMEMLYLREAAMVMEWASRSGGPWHWPMRGRPIGRYCPTTIPERFS
jgi:stage II sporulation protein D